MNVQKKEEEAYIESLPRFADHNSIEVIGKVLEALGHPEKKMHFIHVAGTNGKGSVVKMLDAILLQAGFKTGRFISPHLIRMNERIAYLDKDISDEDFCTYSKAVRSCCERFEVPTLCYFEFFFLMAILYYADLKTDYIILETGLGGTYDATTSVQPILNIITSIGMDHMQILGNTVEEIAAEKAGIITSDAPVVYHTENAAADRVIWARLQKRNVKISLNAGESRIQIHNFQNGYIDFSITNAYDSYNHLLIHSMGVYQTENAATVLGAIDILKQTEKRNALRKRWEEFSQNQECVIREGLKDFSWGARMEFVRPNFCVDGVHNEDAVKRFIDSAKRILEKTPKKHIHILFAAAQDKDYQNVLQPILRELQPAYLWLTQISSGRRLEVEELLKVAERMPEAKACEIGFADNVPKVMELLLRNLKDDELAFSVGSLYLAGEVKQYLADNNTEIK